MSQPQLGGPTPRRSARLSAATPSVARPSVVASTATASRRNGTLPKARALQSQAYGSGSRFQAAEEIVPTTGFAQFFDQRRGNAVTREVDDEVPDWQYQSQSGQDQYSATGDDSPTPSSVNHSKSFGGLRETGLLSGNAVRSMGALNVQQQRVRETIREPFETPRNEITDNMQPDQHAPWHRSLGERIGRLVHDYKAKALAGALGAALFSVVIVFVVIPLVSMSRGFFMDSTNITNTTNTSPGSVSLPGAISSRVAYVHNGLVHWIQPQNPPNPTQAPSEGPQPGEPFDICKHLDIECDRHGQPSMTFDILSVRMFRIEKDHRSYKHQFQDISAEFKAMQNAIRSQQDDLPNVIAARRNKDGQVEIPDELWQAIHSKFISADNIPTAKFNDFLAKNQAKLQELLHTDRSLDSGFESVHRNEIQEAMDQQYLKLSARVDTAVGEFEKEFANKIKAFVTEEARNTFRDQVRMQSLASTNLLINADLNVRKVNYFSTGLGARVEPRGTSTTSRNENKFLATIYRSLLSIPPPPPPTVALQRWDEAGDCWCAATDRNAKNGRAQLAVALEYPVYPTQVTIEHLPRNASPDRRLPSAPKSVELWVEIDDPLQRSSSACSDDGPEGYVCLGEFKYNIDGSNHIQTFDLEKQSLHPIKRVVVRVNSNWGADHTCLYRLRLHGDGLEGNTKAFW